MNTYDQRVYAIGKGPSETTVEAPSNGYSNRNTAVAIDGRVTDVSPGTKDPDNCITIPKWSSSSMLMNHMSEWMKYVYMQFATPTDVSWCSSKNRNS